MPGKFVGDFCMSNPANLSMAREGRAYYDGHAERWVSRNTVLFPAELLLLERFRGKWAQTRMLDIGIGGGRTTSVFSNIVQSYVGVDYSQAMCELVRERFPDIASSIQCIDARDLSGFPEGSFDLVLFSYNGLDHVELEDRAKVFTETRGVLRDKGTFLFSTHNLGVLLPRISREISLRKRLRYRRENPALFRRRKGQLTQAVIREGPVRVVYVDPFEQWQLLDALGLTPTAALDRNGGRVDLSPAASQREKAWGTRHWWLHFLCTARK
jgi:SAM-dependent methyltransferase